MPANAGQRGGEREALWGIDPVQEAKTGDPPLPGSARPRGGEESISMERRSRAEQSIHGDERGQRAQQHIGPGGEDAHADNIARLDLGPSSRCTSVAAEISILHYPPFSPIYLPLTPSSLRLIAASPTSPRAQLLANGLHEPGFVCIIALAPVAQFTRQSANSALSGCGPRRSPEPVSGGWDCGGSGGPAGPG
ncbi:hypothetical protein AXG93_2956s1300 [Marchantia polymorpha subsp. ruderalis]|uniref:Uncharacterized protein n=1 Tax=Marchantia polymorpha subsp. ruderalis TaxID=1480154 RepID=A0A176WAS5_MARPO|nr:hypothetical protein AXG93_2956s1300 [Marchantia polymorpha subsp. ruderalis]